MVCEINFVFEFIFMEFIFENIFVDYMFEEVVVFFLIFVFVEKIEF